VGIINREEVATMRISSERERKTEPSTHQILQQGGAWIERSVCRIEGTQPNSQYAADY